VSPSQNSNFSPYKSVLRGKKRRSTVIDKKVDISKMLQEPKSGLIKKEKEPNEFKRKGKKRRTTVQYESNIINLKDLDDEAKKKDN